MIMNRLIKKDQYGDYMPIYHKEVCDKLYALENLEQDLGCPLDVVFKALKDGIYVKDEDDDILFYYGKVVLDGRGFLHYIECGEMMEGFPLDEYKETWWLSETKEE